MAYTAYTAYNDSPFVNYNNPSVRAGGGLITAGFLIILILGITQSWLNDRRIKHIKSVQDWHIDVANMQIKSLHEEIQAFYNSTHEVTIEVLEPGGNAKSVEAVETSLPIDRITKVGEKPSSYWPWGNHHTETLGHLEAAARKWWYFYEPSDPTTAPTNDMVATWLQDERGISKEKARAIASMLRPDGLPTGPRR